MQLVFELFKLLFYLGKEVFMMVYLVILTLFRFAFYLMSSEEDQEQNQVSAKQTPQK